MGSSGDPGLGYLQMFSSGMGNLANKLGSYWGPKSHANQDYYQAAMQALPGAPQGPMPIPQGLNRMTPQQVQSLIELQGQANKQNQQLYTMNEMLKRVNPNAQPYSANLNPGYAEPAYEAEVIPQTRAKSARQAEEAATGELYNSLKSALYSHPALMDLQTSNPEAFNAIQNNPNIKSLGEFETAVAPIMKAYSDRQKAAQQATEQAQEEGRLELQKGQLGLQQQELEQRKAEAPLRQQELQARINQLSAPEKGTMESYIDDLRKSGFDENTIQNLVLEKVAGKKSGDATLKSHEDLQKQRLQIQGIDDQLKKEKDPQKQAQLRLQRQSILSGVQAPTLVFPFKH